MGCEHLEGRGNVLFTWVSPGHNLVPGAICGHLQNMELEVVLGMLTFLLSSFPLGFAAMLDAASTPQPAHFWAASLCPACCRMLRLGDAFNLGVCVGVSWGCPHHG